MLRDVVVSDRGPRGKKNGENAMGNSFATCMVALALMGTVAVGSAAAETVTFNFFGSSDASASKTFTGASSGAQPPPELKVSAVGGFVYQNATNGLGVGDDYLVTHSEELVFDFTPNSIVFNTLSFTGLDLPKPGGGGGAADETLFLRIIPSNQPAVEILLPSTGTAVINLADHVETAGRTGLKFSLGTDGGNDNFAVSGLTIDYTAPSAVPLPGMLAGGAALLGVVAVRRRGRRAVA